MRQDEAEVWVDGADVRTPLVASRRLGPRGRLVRVERGAVDSKARRRIERGEELLWNYGDFWCGENRWSAEERGPRVGVGAPPPPEVLGFAGTCTCWDVVYRPSAAAAIE